MIWGSTLKTKIHSRSAVESNPDKGTFLESSRRRVDEENYDTAGDDIGDWYYDDWDDESYDDYSYYDYSDFLESDLEKNDCIKNEDGSFSLNGTTACDILIEGADKLTKAPQFDGTYKISGCNAGRPFYKKQEYKEGLFLWFSAYFRDWDVGTSIPGEDDIFEDNSLVFGGMGNEEARPEKVPAGEWYIKAELLKTPDGDMDFVQAKEIQVKCKKGSSTLNKDDLKPQKTSRDVENQAQQDFNKVYNKYLDTEHKKNAKKMGNVARFFVELLVLVGFGGGIWVIRAVFCFRPGKGPAYQVVE